MERFPLSLPIVWYQYCITKYVNLSMSALGVFDQHTSSFLDMLKDLKYDITTRNYIIRGTMTIAVRTTYDIFRRRSKDWDSQELLMF